ncbi:hypothetical protein GCM10007897_14930 [Sphingobium jiangsuense]|uniref:DUF3987 domain-containing protein n=1 Tax=Sphingobium jiangsuense TaxID=870476 RepID=A0A7W6FNQ6_9SPHN|nr:YfjI family protein [Sphingobium jiangsuense]MBB3925063.1 hypothetical protein [Sphingobium jiangsuense]GLT00109.1 hypothetical protein GCM10007897_14930 [Sphingobium jiangsuense]
MIDIEDKIRDSEYARPEPLPLTGEVIPPQDFPVSSLGRVIGGAVTAISRKVQVPVALAANSVLSACSLAVQPHANVILPTGQDRPISLFLVTVANSGDRKSTADEIATDEIARFQRELQEEHAGREVELFAKKLAWDTAKAEALTHSKKKGRDAVEQALLDLGPRPSDPMTPVMTVRVGTTQGLIKQFETARPSLGLMSDEGGSWLGGYGLSEDNRLFTVSTLSDLWDGKPVQRLTGSEGVTSLYGRRLTFHMMIQPVLAGRLLGDIEFKGQGFLSRLLVTQPISLAGTRFVDPTAPVDPTIAEDIAAFNQRLANVIRAPLPIDQDTRALRPKRLPLSHNAQQLWWSFANEMEERIADGKDLEDVRGFATKLPEQAARIAAVLAVFQFGLRTEAIEDDFMACGISVARYYLSEAVRLIGVASPNPILVDAQIVSDWLRKSWTENLISIGAIQRLGPAPMRKRSADQVRDIIAALVRHDHLSDRLPNGGMVSGKKVREAWRVQVRHA